MGDVTGGRRAASARPASHALPPWLPSLPIAAGLVATSLLFGWSLIEYAQVIALSGGRGTDFSQYYVAARLTLAHGWAAPYDVATFMTALRVLTDARDAYANLPPPTLLAMPLTRLPLPAAYGVWNTVLVGAFTVACWAVVPGRGWERALQMLASLSALQVASAIAEGQLAVAVAGLLVLHWWLLRNGRPALAGIALGLAFVKPQNVFLVPAALFLAGHRRAAAASMATAAAVGGLCLAALGPDGLRSYLQTVAFEIGYMPAGHYTLVALLGRGPMLAVTAVPVALALLASRNASKGEVERPLVAAVLGSQLATPYLNGSDLALLIPCTWLTLRAGAPRWVVAVAVVANFVPELPDDPMRVAVMALQLVWLGALALGPLLRRQEAVPAAE